MIGRSALLSDSLPWSSDKAGRNACGPVAIRVRERESKSIQYQEYMLHFPFLCELSGPGMVVFSDGRARPRGASDQPVIFNLTDWHPADLRRFDNSASRKRSSGNSAHLFGSRPANVDTRNCLAGRAEIGRPEWLQRSPLHVAYYCIHLDT